MFFVEVPKECVEKTPRVHTDFYGMKGLRLKPEEEKECVSQTDTPLTSCQSVHG